MPSEWGQYLRETKFETDTVVVTLTYIFLLIVIDQLKCRSI